MSEDHLVSPGAQQESDSDFLFFEDRIEEPPFVYLGSCHPPHLATDLPDHIFSFERAWKEAKPVKVLELIGKPVFCEENEIEDDLIQIELARIIKLMQQNNIYIEIVAGEDQRAVYRYITKILFEQEVDDLKLGGLGRHFFYPGKAFR